MDPEGVMLHRYLSPRCIVFRQVTIIPLVLWRSAGPTVPLWNDCAYFSHRCTCRDVWFEEPVCACLITFYIQHMLLNVTPVNMTFCTVTAENNNYLPQEFFRVKLAKYLAVLFVVVFFLLIFCSLLSICICQPTFEATLCHFFTLK